MVHTFCNEPRVDMPIALSRIIRHKWIPVPGLHIQVCNERLSIEGDCWPLVYQIPDTIDSFAAYPGMPGMGPPVTIDGLLAAIGVMLKEDLVVVAEEDARTGRWKVAAGTSSVKHFTATRRRASAHRLEPTAPVYCRGRNGEFVANFLRVSCNMPHIREGHVMFSAFSRRRADREQPPICIEMPRRTALMLGLALVHAAAGSSDPATLQHDFDDHAFLLGEATNGEESDQPRDSSDDRALERRLAAGSLQDEGGDGAIPVQRGSTELETGGDVTWGGRTNPANAQGRAGDVLPPGIGQQLPSDHDDTV